MIAKEMIAEKVFAESVAKDIRNFLPEKYENAEFQVMQMNKIIGFLVMVFMFLPWRPIVAIVAAVLFVNINGTELYGWQAGLAHGLFFLPNLVRHLFDGDVLFKATNCTTGYHVAWWIATVGSCIGWLVDATFSFMKASAFVGSDKE